MPADVYHQLLIDQACLCAICDQPMMQGTCAQPGPDRRSLPAWRLAGEASPADGPLGEVQWACSCCGFHSGCSAWYSADPGAYSVLGRLVAVYQPLFTAFGASAIEQRVTATGGSNAKLVVTDVANRPKLDEEAGSASAKANAAAPGVP